MALSPATHPDIFKALIIGGAFTPGVVTLSGHDRKEQWEKSKAKGTTLPTTVNHGRDLMQFTATFDLADDEDLDGWEALQKQLLSMTGSSKTKALGVYHPDLVSQQITDVVVVSIGGLTHDDRGGAKASVVFLEYRPPRPKPAAKPQARTGVTTVDRPDPNAAAKRELAALLEQAKNPTP